MQAAERALAEGGVEAGEVTFVVHATTVATNAIIEGKIARSGFVTTDGFRDLLEIARQVRPDALRHAVREGEAARAPRPRRRRGGAARPEGRGAAPARGRLGSRGRRDPAPRGRRVGRRLPPPRLRERRARAAGGRDPGRGAARACRSRSPPRWRRSSASTSGRRRPSSTRSSGPSSSATCAGSRRGWREAGVQAKLLVMQSSGGIFGSDAAARAARVHGRVRARRRGDRVRAPRRDARRAPTSSRSTWAARRRRSASSRTAVPR